MASRTVTMLKKTIFAITALAVTLLAAFVLLIKDKDVTLIGKYQTFLSDAFDEDDGMTCQVQINTTHHLSPFNAHADAYVDMTFHFGGTLQFSDVKLHYLMRLSGDWTVSSNMLQLSPDTASFSYNFLRSSAHNNVEDAMARQLMKFVDVSLIPKLRRKIIEANGRPLHIRFRSPGGLIASADNRLVVMLAL